MHGSIVRCNLEALDQSTLVLVIEQKPLAVLKAQSWRKCKRLGIMWKGTPNH